MEGPIPVESYDKLLRLEKDLVTPTGQRLARERHAFLETFLTQFFAEWDAA